MSEPNDSDNRVLKASSNGSYTGKANKFRASDERLKTSKVIKSALAEINDEVRACQVDSKLIRSEPLQIAITKLYISIFLFYADAIEWYKSSSKRKIRYSLHENFSDRFKDQFDDIKRLSHHVYRTAASGHGAETSFLRLKVEGLERNIRAGFEGTHRLLAEQQYQRQTQAIEQGEASSRRQLLQSSQPEIQARLWQTIGSQGTMALQDEAQGFITEHNALDTGSHTPLTEDTSGTALETHTSPNSTPMTDRDAVLGLSTRLCDFIKKGGPMSNLKPSPNLIANQRIVNTLENWLLSPESRLLCLEGPYAAPMNSKTSLGAAHITWSAVDNNVPSISFFCDAEPDAPAPSNNAEASSTTHQAAANGLLGLLYSLIHQLICLWLPTMPSPSVQSLSPSRFTALNTSDSDSWTPTLNLLRDLLQTAPPLMLCVIDGLQAFDGDEGSGGKMAELVEVLRDGLRDDGKRVLKVLLTTSGFAAGLVPTLGRGEFERLSIQATAGRPGPGKMPLYQIGGMR